MNKAIVAKTFVLFFLAAFIGCNHSTSPSPDSSAPVDTSTKTASPPDSSTLIPHSVADHWIYVDSTFNIDQWQGIDTTITVDTNEVTIVGDTIYLGRPLYLVNGSSVATSFLQGSFVEHMDSVFQIVFGQLDLWLLAPPNDGHTVQYNGGLTATHYNSPLVTTAGTFKSYNLYTHSFDSIFVVPKVGIVRRATSYTDMRYTVQVQVSTLVRYNVK